MKVRQMSLKSVGRSSIRTRFSVAVVGVLAVSALAGCGTTGNTGLSQVRVLNAYIAAPGTDGSLNVNTSAGSLTGGLNLSPGQFAFGGAYNAITSGPFTVSATGPATTTPITFLSSVTLTGNNTYYTVATAGVAGNTGAMAPQAFAIPTYSAAGMPIASTNVAVRVVNLSGNTNPIGLYTNSSGVLAPLATAVSAVPFGYNSTTNAYITLTPAQMTGLSIVDSTAPATALSVSASSNLIGVTFTGGQAYTLYIYGQSSNSVTPLTALFVLDNASP